MSNLKVIILGSEQASFDVIANNLKEALSIIKLQKGADFVSKIMSEQYKFILMDTTNPERTIALNEDVLFADYDGYDVLILAKDIEGDEPVSIGSLLLAGFTAVTGIAVTGIPVWVVGLIGAVAMMGVSMAISAVMQALSPTPEFSTDPAAKQNESNLFNGAPIIRNQGGSVPLIFGNPYCGAVLISSGAFSEEVSV
jgi:predicted phage tail protein